MVKGLLDLMVCVLNGGHGKVLVARGAILYLHCQALDAAVLPLCVSGGQAKRGKVGMGIATRCRQVWAGFVP